MFFVVISSSSCELGFDVSVKSGEFLPAGSVLMTEDLDVACYWADEVHRQCSIYKAEAVDNRSGRLYAQAVSGLTKSMIKKLEKVLDA